MKSSRTKYLPLFALVFSVISCHGNDNISVRVNHPVYALNYASKSISIIDGEKDEIVGTIKLPDIASTFDVAPNGKLIIAITGRGDILEPYRPQIYITDPDGKQDGSIMKVKYIPDNMYVKDSRIGALIHNTITPGKVVPFTVVDLEKRGVISTFELNQFVEGVGFEESDILLYTINIDSNGARILKINLADLSIEELMDLGKSQIFGKKNLFHNGKLYGIRGRKGAMLELNQTLQVINIKTKEIEKIISLTDSPYSLAFVEDKIYVTHFNNAKPSQPDNRVSIIDSKSYEIEKTLEVGKGPAGICYSKSLGKIYTANFWDGSVSVIGANSQKVIKTIPIKTSPSIETFTNIVRCPE